MHSNGGQFEISGWFFSAVDFIQALVEGVEVLHTLRIQMNHLFLLATQLLYLFLKINKLLQVTTLL